MLKKISHKLQPKKLSRPFFICGITTAVCISLMLITGFKTILFICIFLFVASVIMAVKHSPFVKYIHIILTMLLISAIAFSFADLRVKCAFAAAGEDRHISGRIYSVPAKNDNGAYSFLLTDCTVNEKEIPGKISVYAYNCDSVTIGDTASFTAYRLSENAHDGIFYFHSLSERTYLTAITSDKISVIGEESTPSLYSAVISLKKSISDKFFLNMEKDASAVTVSLITGDKSSLPEEISTSFRLSGISHIFAVSGMHLSIWTSLFFLILKHRRKAGILPNISAMVFVIFYCVFTGFSPSVLRSGIMLLFVFAGRILRRHSDNLNSLGIAAILLLLYEPYLMGNVSFLLSFLAAFTVITLPEKINSYPSFPPKKYHHLKKLTYSFTNPLMLSVCVILLTMPVTSLFFGYFSVISPFISLSATPLAQVVMISGGLAQLLPEGSFAAETCFDIAQAVSNMIIDLTAFAGQYNFSVSTLTPVTVIMCLGLSVLGFLVFSRLLKFRKPYSATALTVTAVILCNLLVNMFLSKDATVIYIPENIENTCITLCEKNNYSAVYSSQSTYEDISGNLSFLMSHGFGNTDCLIVPDKNINQDKGIKYLSDKLMPEHTIMNSSDSTKDYFCFSAGLSENVKIYSESNENFTASVIYVDDVSIVICPHTETDFTQKDDAYKSGDILICKESVPVSLDTDNFSHIVIITDNDVNYSSENIRTNKNNDVKITIKGESYAFD